MENFLYNPDRKGKQRLIQEFVVRTQVFDDIMRDLETSDMKTPEQHYLLVGQRGTGKTTLLHRIRYAIEDSKKLNKWLIPVIFTEEQYNISELANLWENVGNLLEDYQGFTGISAAMDQRSHKSNFEELCYDLLEEYLKKYKKKLVLLFDNVGDFLKKISDIEIRRLREILQTRPFIRIIAGSPFHLDSVLDYKQPFFEFFKIIRLDGLSKEETKELLLKLGELNNEQVKIGSIIKETPERIETLRILTGGVPRTIALMFGIFIDYEQESSLKDLYRILDLVTPLYKHRMDDLPKQQQKIVDAVARNWEPVGVKEVGSRVRLQSKLISAQLRQLEKEQIIERKDTDTKNNLYLIKERFWNIWYLMRYGRKNDKERVIWLVEFLNNWYTKEDIDSRIQSFVEKVKRKEFNDEDISFLSNVYSSLSNLTLDNKLLLSVYVTDNFSNSLKIQDIEILENSKKVFEEHEYMKCLEYLKFIRNVDEEAEELVINSIIAVKRDHDFIRSYISGFPEKLTPTSLKIHFLVMTVLSMHILDWDLQKKELLILAEHSFRDFTLMLLAVYNIKKDKRWDIRYKVELEIYLTIAGYFYSKGFETFLLKTFETRFQVNDSFISFKETFEPIYHAIKYNNNPEKINNLPEEMREITQNVYDYFRNNIN
jgi:energy-coupling factor transporter ATP-binding protein EcfA2